MTSQSPDGRWVNRALLLGVLGAWPLLSISSSSFGKLESWREESASAFGKGRRERVVISESGRVRLGHSLKTLGSLDAARVWDLARGPHGEVYAATGDAGKVFKRDNKDDAPWTLAYDATDTQALSVAVSLDGRAFAGTGPSGQVVDLADSKHPASRPHPGVNYIWDLAFDDKGNLYAATGPTGQLWKRSVAGEWSLVLDTKHAHLLCVATAPDGSVYAGSDGEGLVYKVAATGKVSVLYDAPQSEIRTLLVGDDGSLYAGTAAEAGGGGSSRGSSLFSGGGTTSTDGHSTGRPADTFNARTPAQDAPQRPDPARKDEIRPRTSASMPGGSASPRPVTPGDNAVYRIDAEGVAREIFRAKALIFALALQTDRLLVGTGPEGQLYEVRDNGRESTPIARLDNGQILALLADPAGGVLLGTGDPGSVARLDPGYVSEGELLSDVRDTKLISRFGALSWRADQPPETSVRLQIRTGNVNEPDTTWSDWSPEQADAESAQAQVPPGRFVQYRVRLSTRDPAVSPELHSVTVRYQSANLAPEIAKLDVPDVSALDGTIKQTKLTIRWDVSDPNDDDLSFTLFLRKDGWPDWVKLTEQPITDKTYSWDTTAVPVGRYRVRLTATDRPSNNPEDALSRDKVSETFLVDHEAPYVAIKASARRASVTVKDKLTRIVRAAYAIDGGELTPVFPVDGLFDTPKEMLTVHFPDLKPGTHILVVRATDAAGNLGTGDTLIDVR